MNYHKLTAMASHYRKWLMSIGLVLLVLLMLIVSRLHAEKKLRADTNAQAIPTVAVVIAKTRLTHEKVILPGSVQAWHETTIYARTNGYIKKWYVDIGHLVKAGQLLAEIQSPEIDAQLKQAEANLVTAKANESLAQSTAIRWQGLLKTDSVSKQETDEKVSNAKALAAIVNSAQANQDRLRELVSFERVVAPFAGIISSRTTDVGALINAGSGNAAIPLFHLVQANPLRVYVQIPQNYFAFIKPGIQVTLYFAEHPYKHYPAKLLKTAGAINQITRTLLAEFVVNNKQGELLPGDYTEVHFNLPIANDRIYLPVNTLLFRAQGLQVAIVDNNNKIHLRAVHVSRDFGSKVEIDRGLKIGMRVVLNPNDSIFNGQTVQLAPKRLSARVVTPP